MRDGMAAACRGWLLVACALAVGCRSNREGTATVDTASALPSASTSAPASAALWVMAEHGIATADIDGDGQEDVVGLCGDSLEGAVSFCAFAGSNRELVWRLGSFKRDVAYAAHVDVVGTRAVLIDPVAKVHVVRVADGKPLGSVQLTDRPESTCQPAEHPGQLWLRLADLSELLLDVDKQRTAPAPRPASCRDTRMGLASICSVLGNTVQDEQCKAMPLPPKPDGMLPMRVAYDGSIGALLGMHSPGTSYAMVAAFDIVDGVGKLRFARPLADGSPLAEPPGDATTALALAGGRVFARHADALVALGADDGKTLWRAKPGSFMYLHASKRFVYVGRWSALAIYDAAKGTFVGAIGRR